MIATALATVTFVVVALSALRHQGPYAIVGFVGIVVFIGIFTGISVNVGRRRRDQMLSAVQAARPGVPIVPAWGSRETRDDAQRAGVSTHDLGRSASTLALALLPDRVEVWVRGDQEPRWAVRRANAEISVALMSMQGSSTTSPGLQMSDGERSLHCIPFYPHLPGRNTRAHLEQALRDLGEDPADHLDTGDGQGQ